jgi:uncharacterized short protein YbdD (DUF466 family)
MRPAGITLRQVRAMLQWAAATLQRRGRRLAALWQALRSLSGDDAYERYLRHAAAHHPGEPLMTRRDFYRDAEEARWSGVSRCC